MAQKEAKNQSIPPVATCRVLIVDDEEQMRKVMRRTCETLGLPLAIEEACDGEEGWAIYKKFSPAVVVTDVCMPRADGIELLRRIRRTSRETEVIMVTGFADTGMVIEALRGGASNFVEKPFSVQVLSSQIAHSIGRWRMISEASRLESQLERERRRRAQNGRLATVGRLMAGMTAEIQNPLTYLKGNAQLVAQILEENRASFASPDLLTELKALLADIEHGALRIEENITSMKRFQGASAALEDRLVSVDELMNDCVLLVKGRKPGSVDFIVNPAPGYVMIRVHPVEIESCLINLIVNAFESLQPSGGEVRFESRIVVEDTEGGWLEIVVSDNRKNAGSRAMENGAAPNHEQKSGLGFWLWVAYKAAEQNGAQLEINSSGEGTRAVLSLPWYRANKP